MNISNESKQNAVNYITSEIEHIIKDYEPRVPGSKGENQALDHMVDELGKMCGEKNVVKQPFKVAPRAFFGWTFFVTIFTILGNAIYYMTPVFSILCYVIAILPMFMEFVFFECVEAEYRVLCKLDADAKMKEYVRQKFFEYRQNLSFELEREAREKGNIFDVDFDYIGL